MKKINHLLFCATLICSSVMADTGNTMFQEIRKGDKEAIKQRLEQWQDCSQTDENGNNGLHIAAEEGQTKIVDMLTTESDLSDWWNWSCSWGRAVTFQRSAATLPNKNGKNKKGKTPLHCAIENDQISTAEKLLTKNADATIPDDENLSPVFITVKKDNPNFLPLFIEYKLIEQKINGENMLHCSIRNSKLNMVTNLAHNEKLVYQENNQGYTPAMLAATKTDTTTLKILQAKGINLNARNRIGQQPIHATAYAYSTDTAKYLLENGAFIDATDNNGDTPLLHSVIAGNKPVMDLFLAYKADAKKCNAQGKGIFALAVDNKRYKLIEHLKQHPDVNINDRDNQGMTAFMNATIAQNHTMMQDLIACGVNVRIGDKDLENALHKAARNGDTKAAKIILEADRKLLTDINKNGENPLFIAIQAGKFDLAKLFVANDTPSVNNDGDTPAHTAAATGNVKALRNCIRYDSQMVLKRNKDNYTPFLLATAKGNCDAADFLLGDNEFINEDFTRALNIAYKNNDHTLRAILEKRNTQRKSADKFIVDKCMAHRDLVSKNYQLKDLLGQKGVIVTYTPTCINRHYSEEELYVMTEAQRKEILYHCEECVNKETNNNTTLLDLLQKEENERLAAQVVEQLLRQQQQEYDRLAAKKRADEEVAARIQAQIKLEQAQAAEQRRILVEQQRKEEENRKRLVAEQAAELERSNKQKKSADELRAQQAEYKDINEQHAALNRINEDEQKNALDAIAEQKAGLDRIAAAKAASERARQQQHAQALEKQHPHVEFNLQPSAPPMEELTGVPHQCSACQGEISAKPVPCAICKSKLCGNCAKLAQQNKGECPACQKFTQKENGKCLVCWEELEVTRVPADCCKVGSERICKTCLSENIQKDITIGQADRCPVCHAEKKLNAKIVKIILTQK